MAMSQKSRTQIYQTFEPLLGEVATEEMLAHFPARDLDQPVTVAHLRAELADLRVEMRRAAAPRWPICVPSSTTGSARWSCGWSATQAAFLAVVVTVIALLR